VIMLVFLQFVLVNSKSTISVGLTNQFHRVVVPPLVGPKHRIVQLSCAPP